MKPNILLIMTDQHSPHVVGFAGNDVVKTPALDELAARSARFSSAYCQSPLCVPSRNSFLTGKLPDRCHAWDNHSPIRPEEVTIPGWFAGRGYTTACVGKMHFRGDDQIRESEGRPKVRARPRASAQYLLPDGRLVPADEMLYATE